MPPAIQSKTTHNGRLLRVEVLSTTDDAGSPMEREVVRHPGSVVIVPVLDDGRLVLIRNRRVAVGDTLWELPAGTLERDERPDVAAARELEEETGYRPRSVRHLSSFYSSPGFLDEILHLYVGEGLAFVGQRLDPGEEISVAELDVDEVMTMIADGRIRDGKTIAGVLMWARLVETSA
jgi:ADP-ribose pyrophosphatase